MESVDFLNKIQKLLEYNYNIGTILNIQPNNVGRQTHYVVKTQKDKYFVKIINCKNKNINKDDEIKVCKILRNNKVNYVPEYVSRFDGDFLTKIDNELYFNIQKFITGDIWKKYEAPDWLLFASVDVIADIHNI